MRLMRQLLTESVFLAASGGAFGILLAVVSLNLLTVILPANFPRADGISIDLPVLGFTLIVSLATGIVFGLAPAIQASRFASTGALKEGGRGSTEGFRHNRFRSALVVTEMALSLMLLVGAGLMIRSLLRLQQVNPGFSPGHILTMSLSLPAAAYPNDVERAAFFQRLIEKSNAIPGVLRASATTLTPMGGNNLGVNVTVEGRTYAPGAHPIAEARAVTPQYFDTLKISLIKGRFLLEQDSADRPKAVVINQKMAIKRFPGEDPIGQRLKLGLGNFSGEIVGVAGDVKERGLEDEAAEMVYLNYQQAPYWRDMVLMVRTAGDPLAIAAALHSAVASVDRNQPVSRIRTMESILGDSIAEPRFRTVLLGLFAFLSLALAMIGIYGVMSYSASRRTHEIGIRMALGASRSDMIRLVVGQGMSLALAGILLGIVGALGLTQAISSLLFGIDATDPTTFAVTGFSLAVVAFLACYFPARKAASFDPMRALRYE
jgi:putative ABC transport system permease protein